MGLFFQVKEGSHNHILNFTDVQTLLGIHFIDEDEVYKIVSKNKKIKNCNDITHRITKNYFLEKDNKVFKDLSKIANKFNNYIEDNTTLEDENIERANLYNY